MRGRGGFAPSFCPIATASDPTRVARELGVLAGKTRHKTYILAFLLENRTNNLALFAWRYQKGGFAPQLTFISPHTSHPPA
jgi:hypothetical protein